MFSVPHPRILGFPSFTGCFSRIGQGNAGGCMPTSGQESGGDFVAEESTKRSAFPLLLACWTALFLAASNCSSATKSSYDRNLSLGIENSYLTGILFLFWALKFYVSVQMDLVPMPSNQSFIFFMWFECHHLPATLQVTTSDPRTDGRMELPSSEFSLSPRKI